MMFEILEFDFLQSYSAMKTVPRFSHHQSLETNPLYQSFGNNFNVKQSLTLQRFPPLPL